MNNFVPDNLRIEIAYLQEDIPSFIACKAKFKIPVIMTEGTVASLTTSNKNILNRRNGNLKGAPINLDDTIKLDVPLEYIYFYGAPIVPKNTRFMVAFVGGNINDIKIVGRYDSALSQDFSDASTILTNFSEQFKSLLENYQSLFESKYEELDNLLNETKNKLEV